MASSKKTLGGVLNEQIPELVVSELKLSPVAAEEFKETLTQKLGATVVALGKVVERKLETAIVDKHGANVDQQTRDDIIESLGERLAKKFSAAISDELKSDPTTLKTQKKLVAKLDEVAEGYRQFSESDIDAISKDEIKPALKAADTKAEERKTAEEAADKARRLAARRVQPRTPVKPAEERPSWTDRSWGGKGSSSRSWGGK